MDQQDIQNNRFFAALSYWGILLIVPLFFKSDSKYARFHANQGLVLFMAVILFELAAAALRVFMGVSPELTIFIVILLLGFNLFFMVLQILGTVRAIKGEMTPLPIIGRYQVLK